MRKIVTLLALAAALILGLSSCDLDFVDTYTFSFTYSLSDEEALPELKSYMEAFTSQPNLTATYECPYSEAMNKSVELYNKGVEQLDVPFIADQIKNEQDGAALYGIMSATKTRTVIGYIVWNWEWKQVYLDSVSE